MENVGDSCAAPRHRTRTAFEEGKGGFPRILLRKGMPYPLYGSDLDFSELFLFPKCEEHLKGQRPPTIDKAKLLCQQVTL